MLLLPLAAAADEPYFYIGASVGGITFVDLCGARTSTCQDNDTAWKAYAGRRFTRNFAAELHYADLGIGYASAFFNTGIGGSSTVTGSRNRGVGISGRFIWPVDESRLSLFGKVGLQFLSREHPGTGQRTLPMEDRLEPIVGAGAELALFRNFAVRGEAEYFAVLEGALFSIGLQLRF